MLSSFASPLSTPSTARDLGLVDLPNLAGGAPGIVVCTNPTLGTAISGHAAATTFDETKALLYCYNGGKRDIYPLSMLLKLSNAGTAGTTVRFTMCLDAGPRTPSSGNGATNTLTKGNTSNGAGSAATVLFGAVVIPGASSGRQITGDFQYRNVIGVVTDTYGAIWGAAGADLVALPQASTAGTSEVDITVGYEAVRIPPGMVFTIHQWSASQSGAYQFEPVRFSYLEV